MDYRLKLPALLDYMGRYSGYINSSMDTLSYKDRVVRVITHINSQYTKLDNYMTVVALLDVEGFIFDTVKIKEEGSSITILI